MSQICPLCGKNKSEKSLFCDSCKTKIEKEYELDVPDEKRESSVTSQAEIATDTETISSEQTELSTNENSQIEAVPLFQAVKPKKRRGKFVLIMVISILLLALIFVFFGRYIRDNNLDKSHWNVAQKENTTASYLAYMQDNPKGKYYEQAHENLMKLKATEADSWQKLQTSDNSAELRDFLTQFPESPYNPLVRKRLDSITWIATLNDNTAESYSKYMVLSQSGEFDGDYFGDAQQRYEMLFQSYPVAEADLDSIKLTVDGFFAALSAVDAANIRKYLAPEVYQFFNLGKGTREKIAGDLVISGSKTQAPTIKFNPNIGGVAYEKTMIDHFKVNVPLQKTFVQDGGKTQTVSGYIVHIELDRNYQIIIISESKPNVGAK